MNRLGSAATAKLNGGRSQREVWPKGRSFGGDHNAWGRYGGLRFNVP